jgi:hypothetical protein
MIGTVREKNNETSEKSVESMDKVKGEKCMHNHHPSEPPGSAQEALY